MKSILNKSFPVLKSKNSSLSTFGQYNNVTHAAFVPLGKRVIFQGFSFALPMFINEDEDGLYQQVLPELKHLHDIGITDFWWPPPYKALSLNEYKEGYAVFDRYDVGEFNQQNSTRTKYGTRAQLEYALTYAHTKGLRNMADIVPNQMYMGTLTVGPCIWCSDNVNMADSISFYNSFPVTNTDTVSGDRPVCGLNTAWVAGGGLGQEKYGLVPQFDYYHTNSFNPSTGMMSNDSGTGMYCVLRDKNFIPYRFYGNGNSKNYLPSWLQQAYNENNYITIQSTNTYLLINQGWVDYVHFIPYACFYQEEYDITSLGAYSFNPINGFSTQTNYIPVPGEKQYCPDMRDGSHTDNSYLYLLQRQRFLDYLKELPIDPSISTNTSDDDLIIWIKNYVGSSVGSQMSTWIAEQPGYGGQSVFRNGFGYYTKTVVTTVTNTNTNVIISNNTVTTYFSDYPYSALGTSTTSTTSGYFKTTITTTLSFNGSSWVVWNQNPSSDDATVMNNFMFDVLPPKSTFTSDLEGEFLLGTDMNNENIDVLYDTVNWQTFLLNLGFDGFRFDAAGWYSNKVLTNSAILMSNLYGKDLENHLSVLEDYGDGQVTNYLYSWYTGKDYSTIGITTPGNTAPVNLGYSGSFSYPQISYDTSSYYAMSSTVKQGFESDKLMYYFQSSLGGSRGSNSRLYPTDMDVTLLPSLRDSFIGGQFRGGSDCFSRINWSFVNNHDMELNNQIKQYPTTDGSDNATLEGLRNSSQQYCEDRRIRNKIKAHKNIVMSYAMMLINDFTIPSVYYGDMYDPHEPYMSVKSPFYAGIELCLRIRQRYVKGQQFNEYFISNVDVNNQQTYTTANALQSQGILDAVAMIRFGDDRDTGCVLVISVNENLSFTASVPFGRFHANQTVKNVFAIGEEYAQTDASGNFDVFITPENTPITQGYMSLWIPI